MRGREDLVAYVLEQLTVPRRPITLVGEPGIGKTTVWAEGLVRAEADWVWSARCLQIEAELGLAVLADFFAAVPDDVVDELAPPQRLAVGVVLYREARPDDVPVGERLLGVTTLSLLRALAARGTVVLGIDDLQWCDPSSFEAFSYALHRLNDAPVATLATRRSGVSRDFDDAVEVTVVPLGSAAVAQLVRSTAGQDLEDVIVSDIVARSDGNPFFAKELAGQAAMHPDERRLPASLREVLDRRLVRLDPRTRLSLIDVAVRGAPPVVEVQLDELREATDADILQADDGRVRFTHPLLASAVIERALSSELRAAHERAAGVSSDPVAAVLHRVQCEQPNDDLAAALDAAVTTSLHRGDRAGGRQLAKLALSSAAGGRRTADRLMRFAELDTGPRTFERDTEVGRELLEIADSPTAHAVALMYMACGLRDRGKAVAIWQQAAAVPDLPEDCWETIVGAAAGEMFDLGRTAEAISTLENALPTAADTRKRPEMVATLAFVKRCAGVPDDGGLLDQVIERSRAVRSATDDWPPRAHSALGMAGVIALMDDRHEDAALLLDEAAQAATRSGEFSTTAHYMSMLSCRTGQLDRALAQLSEEIDSEGATSLGMARLALIQVWRGDTAAARACIDDARELVDSVSYRGWIEINFAAGFLDLLAGDVQGAWCALRDAATQLDTMGYHEPSHPPVLALAVEAAAAMHEPEIAAAYLHRLEGDSAALKSRFGLAAARRSRGFIAQAQSINDQAEECFADSAAAFLSLGVRLEGARALLALGSLLRRTGQRRRARDALHTARTIFAESGARSLLESCDLELGRISGRKPASTSEMTESELQVAKLVSTGMRNADVARALHLSVKTVETHLGHLYQKLGVNNRTELTSRLTSLPRTGAPRDA